MCVCVVLVNLMNLPTLVPHWTARMLLNWKLSWYYFTVFYIVLHNFVLRCSAFSCDEWQAWFPTIWFEKKQVTVPPLIISNVLGISGAHPPYNRLNALMGRPPAFILSLRATYTQRSGLEGRGPRSVSRRTGAWWHRVDGCELCVSR